MTGLIQGDTQQAQRWYSFLLRCDQFLEDDSAPRETHSIKHYLENVPALLCRGDSFYTQVAVSNQKVYISQETQQQRLRMNKKYISSNGKVEFVGRAEAREPSPELNIAAPMSTDPFPFLQLPREIRDLI